MLAEEKDWLPNTEIPSPAIASLNKKGEKKIASIKKIVERLAELITNTRKEHPNIRMLFLFCLFLLFGYLNVVYCHIRRPNATTKYHLYGSFGNHDRCFSRACVTTRHGSACY